MKSTTKATTIKTTTTTIEIDQQDIVNFLLQNGYFQKGCDFKSFDVFVRVPGGGDYSNCNLDIDNRCPIIVKFEKIEEN